MNEGHRDDEHLNFTFLQTHIKAFEMFWPVWSYGPTIIYNKKQLDTDMQCIDKFKINKFQLVNIHSIHFWLLLIKVVETHIEIDSIQGLNLLIRNTGFRLNIMCSVCSVIAPDIQPYL